MKNKFSLSSKNSSLEGTFTSLNNDEMVCIKGGTSPIPPLPPSGGVDFPLSVTNSQNLPVLQINVKPTMPDAASNAAVAFI